MIDLSPSRRFTLGILLFLPVLLLSTTGWAQAPNRFQKAIKKRIVVQEVPGQHRVDVTIDNQLLTSYHFNPTQKKPFLHPINSPKGNALTRGWPVAPKAGERIDHPHHTGYWFSYEDVNGVDYWNNSDKPDPSHKRPFGTIRHKRIARTGSGQSAGSLVVESEWVDPDGRVVMEQATLFRFSGEGSDRIIDRYDTLKAVGGEVRFNDAKDGLVGLRLARTLEQPTRDTYPVLTASLEPGPAQGNNSVQTGEYVNAESLKGDSVWGKRSDWCMLQGRVNNEPVTIALLDHTRNLGHPTYWHARGYGLFAANPFGQEVFSRGAETMAARIPKGRSIVLRYRLLIQSGRQLTEQDAQRKYALFNDPEEELD